MSQGKVLVFIPTYNERENVERMCAEIKALNLGCDILFMDDNSPDGTGRVLDGLAEKFHDIRVVHRSGKLGIGSAHLDGITFAFENGYERLVTMDCDFTHSPADIVRLLDASEGYDITLGSRYMQKNSLPGWSPFRRLTTLFAHFLTKSLLGIKCDASGALRAYNLNKIPLRLFQSVKSRSYSFFFESLFVLTNNGFTVKEIPIVLPARTYGHSKMTFLEAGRSARFLLRLSLEKMVNPGRFQIGREIDALNPGVQDPQNWDPYWDRKSKASGLVYEAIATVYRQLFIKRNLEAALKKHFPPQARLLHAGCGSGQVDVDLHKRFQVTAVDVSREALDLYSKNNPAAHRIEQADILALPYPDQSFDGIYNLGVLEHFTHEDIHRMLNEFQRVLKPGGKTLLFWPHRRATSVAVLKAAKFLIKKSSGKDVEFHPAEISLLKGRSEAQRLLHDSALDLIAYSFNLKDLFIQAVVVAEKR